MKDLLVLNWLVSINDHVPQHTVNGSLGPDKAFTVRNSASEYNLQKRTLLLWQIQPGTCRTRTTESWFRYTSVKKLKPPRWWHRIFSLFVTALVFKTLTNFTCHSFHIETWKAEKAGTEMNVLFEGFFHLRTDFFELLSPNSRSQLQKQKHFHLAYKGRLEFCQFSLMFSWYFRLNLEKTLCTESLGSVGGQPSTITSCVWRRSRLATFAFTPVEGKVNWPPE